MKSPNGEVNTYQVTFESADYIFAECKEKPACRGFYTTSYINKNKV